MIPVIEPTTTTITTDPFAVPAVVDLPYVQRVLETIYRLSDEATRYAYATKVPDAELSERLDAIFGGPALEEAKRVLSENAAEGYVRLANPPGDAEVRAVDILQATSTCMVVRANLDFGSYYKDPPPAPPQGVVQLSKADVLPFNPTGWGVLVAGDPQPGTNTRVCR